MWLRSWLFLMRARVRLAWAVLAGHIETKPTVGLLLTSLTVGELAKQQQEIVLLQRENEELRIKVREMSRDEPYR